MYPSFSGVTMNIESSSFASRPVFISARRSLNLDETFYDSMMRRSRDELWRFLTQAMEVGDQTAIRRISQTFLSDVAAGSFRIEKDRLILTAAAAQVDYHDVKFVRDLSAHLQRVKVEINLVRLGDPTFGLRTENDENNPFLIAELKINETIGYVRQLIVGGNRNVTARIIQGLSYLGDFPLADGIADAMWEFGTSAGAPAVLGAKYRHLHKQPELAIKYVKKNAAGKSHSWTHNNLCAAHCDGGDFTSGLWHVCHSLSLLTYGYSSKEIKERHYAANTLRRPLRELKLGNQDSLSTRFASLNPLQSNWSDEKVHASARQSAVYVARILKSLGMLDLSRRVTRVIAVMPDDWVPHALVEIDQETVMYEMMQNDEQVVLIEREK